MRKHRMFVLGAGLLALSLFAAACSDSGGDDDTGGSASASESSAPKPELTVGVSGAFAENQLVAEMYAQVLEDAGYRVERQLDLRSRELSQSALEAGQIDVKPEYLSSLLLFVDPNAVASNDADAVAAQLRALLAERGVDVLAPSPAQDQNQFVANAQTAQRFGLTTMSSVVRVADQLNLGGPPECPQRPFCLAGLHERYGIMFGDFIPLDAGGPKTVEALNDDVVQVALLFSTDPAIGEIDLLCGRQPLEEYGTVVDTPRHPLPEIGRVRMH